MSFLVALPPTGTQESETLDFKSEGYALGDKAAVEVALDIAQFANTRGGSIVLGACESSDALTEYVPIADVSEQEQKIVNSAGARLSAPVGVDFERFSVDGGQVLVVQVRPSIDLVGVRTRSDSWRFPHRVGSHRKYWSFREVQGMDSRTRRGRLLIERIPNYKQCKFVIDAVLDGFNFEYWRVTELKERALVINGQGMNFHVPYSYVEEVTEVLADQYVLTLDCRFTKVSKTMAYVHKKELRTPEQQRRDKLNLERQRSGR